MLNLGNAKFLQEVTNNFPDYTQTVNWTKFTALGSIATQQANPPEHTMQKTKQFLDLPRKYVSTTPVKLMMVARIA